MADFERLLADQGVTAVEQLRQPGRNPPVATIPSRAQSKIKEVLNWALQNLRGVVRNSATGFDIDVARAGLEKATSDSAIRKSISVEAHLEAVRNLRDLLARARLEESRPATKQTDTISTIHRLVSEQETLGQVYLVRMTVREHKNPSGKKFYSLEAVEMKRPAGKWLNDGQANPAVTTPTAGPSDAATPAPEVKPASRHRQL